jgi:hypothetical protein
VIKKSTSGHSKQSLWVPDCARGGSLFMLSAGITHSVEDAEKGCASPCGIRASDTLRSMDRGTPRVAARVSKHPFQSSNPSEALLQTDEHVGQSAE